MQPGASVQSLEELALWRARLEVFREEALDALSAAALEVQRAEGWLDECGRDWHRAVRAAEDDLHIAQQELRTRRFPDAMGRMPDTTLHERNVRRAQGRLEYCREQGEVVRRWRQKLRPAVTEHYDGPARRLGHFLEADAARALAVLHKQLAAVRAYLELNPPPSQPPAAPGPEAP